MKSVKEKLYPGGEAGLAEWRAEVLGVAAPFQAPNLLLRCRKALNGELLWNVS